MTTVVATRKGIAADRLLSGGHRAHTTKIFRVNGNLIGFSGIVAQALRFIQWRQIPEAKPAFSADSDFNALEVTPLGILYWDAEMVAVPLEDDYAAIGSGGQYALGALSMGASLETAIKIASRWDCYTGAKVQTLYLSKGAR